MNAAAASDLFVYGDSEIKMYFEPNGKEFQGHIQTYRLSWVGFSRQFPPQKLNFGK